MTLNRQTARFRFPILLCIRLSVCGLLLISSVLPVVSVHGGSPPAHSDAWVIEELPGGPRQIPKGLAMALQALADGAFEEASRLAEAFVRQASDVSLGPWKRRARVIASRAYLEMGRPSEALRILGEEDGSQPPGLQAHVRYLKARALENLGRFRAAAEAYLAIYQGERRSGPLAPASRAAASLAWYRAGDCAKAVSAARALESRFPGHREVPKLLMLRGRCLEEDRPSDAARIYHRLWLRHPLDEAAGQAERRLLHLQKRGVVLPRPTTVELIRRARTLQRARKVREAIRGWRDVLTRPLSADMRVEAVYALGLDLYFLRDNRGAAERLRWVAEHDRGGGRGAKALYYLARIDLREGDPAGFQKAGEELLASYPGNLWARRFLYLRARVEEDNGLLERALGRYRLLAAKHPGTQKAREARWRIGWIHFRRGRFQEAEETFARLAREHSRTPVGQAAFYWAGRAAEGAERLSAPGYYRAAGRMDAISYYGQLAAKRLGGHDHKENRGQARTSPPFLKRPPLSDRMREVVGEADRLLLAGLFRAAADVLKDGAFASPYFNYQRARLLYRARDYRGALRVLQGPTFWRVRVRGNGPPADFWQMMYPLDRRTLGIGRDARPASRPIAQTADRVDPLLVSAVILAESFYDQNALSIAGAMGLMQLMPETGRRIARRLGLPPPSPDDFYRPDLNVLLGSEFLRSLLAHFGGRPVPAVAAYNAGLEVARKWWSENGHLDEASFVATIPYRETRRYVRKVMAYYRQYQLRYRDGSQTTPREGIRGNGP